MRPSYDFHSLRAPFPSRSLSMEKHHCQFELLVEKRSLDSIFIETQFKDYTGEFLVERTPFAAPQVGLNFINHLFHQTVRSTSFV